MQDSLLFKIWKSLDASEQDAILLAAESPLFNQRETVIKMVKILHDINKTDKNVTKEELSFLLFNSPKPDVKVRHQLNYTLELVRKTLAFLQNQKFEERQQLAYVQKMGKKASTDILERELSRARRAITTNPIKNSAYYLDLFHLDNEYWEIQKDKKRGLGDLEQVHGSLEKYIAYQVLRQACASVAHQVHANSPIVVPFLNEVLKLAEAGKLDKEPAIMMFFYGYQSLIDENNTVVFKKLKKHLFEFEHIFPLNELRDIYVLAINFCIKKLNTYEREFVREAFILYQRALELDVFIENGLLSRFTYRNILKNALLLEEWDWALNYLEGYKKFLPKKEQANIYRYNLATYYFHRPNYAAALELLRHVEFRDTLYNYDARRMLLLIYFNEKSWDALDSLLDSFSIYIRRQKNQGYYSEMYFNLVRYVKRYLRLTPSDKQKIVAFQEDVTNEKYLAERSWLLEIAASKR